jgi:hypothetical protein
LRFGFADAAFATTFVPAAVTVLAAACGGELTGFPHFRQNCASSGNPAPHLLHARLAVEMSVEFLLVSELTKCLISKRQSEAVYLAQLNLLEETDFSIGAVVDS